MRLSKVILILMSLFSFLNVFSQTNAQKNAVLLNAVAYSNPPKITLNWNSYAGVSSYSIYRKVKTDTDWTGPIQTYNNGSTLTYDDFAVSTNVYYEYKIVRVASNGTGYGYIASGIDLDPVEYRGKMVLLIDNSFTTPLSSQLQQLVTDLKADGWNVLRHDVSRNTSVVNLRNVVKADYDADPAGVKALYIVGHFPAPYSGNMNPDGHGNHTGAWPCDGFYGEVTSPIGTGGWTDNITTCTTCGTPARNLNASGDGKYDQNNPPSSVELQVGRLDLFTMTNNGGGFGFYQGLTEQQATINYLNRAHNFKTKQFTPQYRGIVFDNFTDVATPLAGCGYRNISALIGASNMTTAPGNGPEFMTLVNNQSYLWTYACGGGSPNAAANVGSTDKYAGSNGPFQMGGVFNMMFGSYFGDWDQINSFLVAPLASGGLTSAWSGIPNWWFHHMGMGDNIGYSTLLSMNNSTLYTPLSGGNPTYRCHMALLGDPSLRQDVVAPPTNLQTSSVGGNVYFSWSASPDVVDGYYLYEIDNSTGVITRIVPSMQTGTSFLAPTIPFVTGKQYMVRAVKLQVGYTGKYYNLSLGSIFVNGIPTTPPPIKLSAKAFLGGSYVSGTGLMYDSLRVHGYIPLTQPYTGFGYTHVANTRNETIQPSVLSTVGNNAIIDWVVVELRDPSTFAVLASRSALIQSDGDVVDMDGISPLEFDMVDGNYFIAIKHRNHLGMMTVNPISLTTAAASVDFSALPLYGTNSAKMFGSVQTLWSGNTNFNTDVKYTGISNDRDPILVVVGGDNPTNVVPGYNKEDVNMDGMVKYTGVGNDRDPILVNVGGSTPNNTVSQQIP